MMDTKKEIFLMKDLNVLIIAIICTLLWGSAYPCIKIGYEFFQIGTDDTFTKILFAGLRFLLAGIITILISTIINKKLIIPKRDNVAKIILLGIVQTTMQYIFFYIGLSYTTGIKSAILNSIGTFIAVILAHFIFINEKITSRKLTGCIFGFLGVIIINLGTGDFDTTFTLKGEGFIIFAAATFALGTIISKEVSKLSDPIIATGYQLSIGGLILLVIGVIGGGKLNIITIKGLMILIYLALLSAIAFTLWTILLKYNTVSKVTIYNFLVPIFGAILSAVFLGESFMNIKNIIALIFVCVGIYIVNKGKKEGKL